MRLLMWRALDPYHDLVPVEQIGFANRDALGIADGLMLSGRQREFLALQGVNDRGLRSNGGGAQLIPCSPISRFRHLEWLDSEELPERLDNHAAIQMLVVLLVVERQQAVV